jgi:hypothetical protein
MRKKISEFLGIDEVKLFEDLDEYLKKGEENGI